jgi:hypothetical protein
MARRPTATSFTKLGPPYTCTTIVPFPTHMDAKSLDSDVGPSRHRPILELTGRDAERGSPHPCGGRPDGGPTMQRLRERLSDRVAGHLSVPTEGENGPPQARTVLAVDLLKLLRPGHRNILHS